MIRRQATMRSKAGRSQRKEVPIVAAGATEAVGQGKGLGSGPFLAGNSQSASGPDGRSGNPAFLPCQTRGKVTAFLNSVRSFPGEAEAMVEVPTSKDWAWKSENFVVFPGVGGRNRAKNWRGFFLFSGGGPEGKAAKKKNFRRRSRSPNAPRRDRKKFP